MHDGPFHRTSRRSVPETAIRMNRNDVTRETYSSLQLLAHCLWEQAREVGVL
jgi:hypothetical protein